MNTLQRANRVRHTGVGLALLAALALVNGCVSEQNGDASSDRATGAMASAEHEIRYTCNLGGGTLGTLRFFPTSEGVHATCSTTDVELPDARREFCRGTICPECRDLHRDLGCIAVP
jgi:hypothetical protein